MVKRSRLQSTPSPSRRIWPRIRAAGLVLPLPDPLDERLAAEVVAGLALLGQLALDDVLGGDAGVVHAGQPQRLVALHALAAGEGV